MKTLDIVKKTTIAEMVTEDYRKATVFKKFGLDFCCGGKKTLEKACREKNIDLAALTQALDDLDVSQPPTGPDVNKMELDALIDHIVHTHHSYVAESIPVLTEFSDKVAKVHGVANPEVLEINRHFKAVAAELANHMWKEEDILFPYIRKLAVAKRFGTPILPPPFGTVANPINMMEAEHDHAGGALASIDALSNHYTPPAHACNTYRVLYAKLQEFENDLHRHVHLENNILFPKAIALEKALLVT